MFFFLPSYWEVQANSGEQNNLQTRFLGYSETLLLGLNWISRRWSPVCNLWEEMGGSSGWADLGKSPRSWNSTGMFCWRLVLQQGSISESPPSAYPLHLSHSSGKRMYILMPTQKYLNWVMDRDGWSSHHVDQDTMKDSVANIPNTSQSQLFNIIYIINITL